MLHLVVSVSLRHHHSIRCFLFLAPTSILVNLQQRGRRQRPYRTLNVICRLRSKKSKTMNLVSSSWTARLILLLAFTQDLASATSLRGVGGTLFDSKKNYIHCHVVYAEILTEEKAGGDSSDLFCLTKLPETGFRESIPLRLPASFVQENTKSIQSGNFLVSVPTEFMKGGSVSSSLVVPDSRVGSLQLLSKDSERRQQRRLSKEVRSGTKRLLAVRLSANGGSEVPEETVKEIQNTIFGSDTTQNLPTVVSQYAAVSHGALQFVPAQGVGIENGVIEIVMDASLAMNNVSIQGPMLQEILKSAAGTLGDLDEVADHIIFCLPTGSILNGSAKWTAFTYLYEPYSYYQRSRCTKLSVPMHEMGHSLGYKHSGKGDDSYGDEQGYMGYAINKMYGPRKGFNAHKHWMSGWFNDRLVDIEAELLRSGALAAPLVAYVDASNLFLSETEAVVLKIGNLYVQYNRAKGYNSGTYVDQKDRVTVTYAESEENVSDLVAALGQNEIYTHPDFGERGADLVIEVCSIDSEQLGDVDYALVSIHLDDGIHTSFCGDPTIADKTWTGKGYSWLSDSDSMPSDAPTFNEDGMAETYQVPSLAPTRNTRNPVSSDSNPDIVGIEVLVENGGSHRNSSGKDASNENESQGISVILIIIVGGAAATLLGLAYSWCASFSVKRASDSKEVPEELEPTETDLSEREDEDDVVQVRMLPSPEHSKPAPIDGSEREDSDPIIIQTQAVSSKKSLEKHRRDRIPPTELRIAL